MKLLSPLKKTFVIGLFFSINLFAIKNIYSQITVSGATNAPGPFTSLTGSSGLFAALNSTSQAGNNIIVTITASESNESGVIQLTGAAGMWSSLTISPTISLNSTISGSYAGALIRLSGSSNVTINGSVSGSTLTIANTNTSAAATIQFINGASNNVVKHINIQSAGTADVVFSSTSSTAGNNNNTISYCNIGPYSTNYPSYGISSTGNISYPNSNETITNNNIYNCTTNFINVSATGNGNSWNISNNNLYSARTGTISQIGINFLAGSNSNTISNNYIGGSAYNCGASAWTNSGGTGISFTGISIKAGISAASEIINNVIANLNFTGSLAGGFTGISVTAGYVNVGVRIDGTTAGGNTLGGNAVSPITFSSSCTGSIYGISFTSTSSAGCQISNNTISQITGSGSSSFYGINLAAISASTTLQSNTISNINLNNSSAVTAFFGIYHAVVASNSLTISLNNINTITNSGTGSFRGMYLVPNAGAYIYNINNNTIGTGSAGNITTASNATECDGILLINSSVTSSCNFNGNTISGLKATGAIQFYAINLTLNNSSANASNIQNNNINTININGAGNSSFYGIAIQGGLVNIGGNNSGNIIGSTSSSTSIQNNGNSSGATYGIYISSAANGNTITGNTISGFTTSGATALTGIYCSTGTTTAISIQNNIINGITMNNNAASTFKGMNLAAGMINCGNTTGNIIGSSYLPISYSGTSTAYGISCTATAAVNIGATGNPGIGNTISNITASYGGSSVQVVGIYLNANIIATIAGNNVNNLRVSSTSAANIGIGASASVVGISLSSNGSGLTLSQNTVYSLINANNGSTAVNVVGMYFNGATSGTQIIAQNFIHSLSTSSAGAVQQGINIAAGIGASIQNNIIRLGIDGNGNPINTSANITGIYKNSAASENFYFNSIYIGGSVSISNINTAAFLRAATGADIIENNIFDNVRSTTSGTGINYAYILNNATTITSDYNIYNGNNDNVASIAGAACNLQGLRANTLADLNSIVDDPNFVNPAGNVSTVNLKIQSPTPAWHSGTPISGVTVDFYNNMRNTVTPDIGADESGTYTLPTVYNVSGSGNYCPGILPNPISLSGSDANITYQLYINSSPVSPFFGGQLIGTGSALSFNDAQSLMINGTYTVVATNTSGLSGNMNGSPVVLFYSLPHKSFITISPSNPAICYPDVNTFTVTSDGSQPLSYQWLQNNNILFTNTNSTYTATTTGSYSCIVSNLCTSNGITSTASSLTVISIPSSVSISPANSGNICSYQQFTATIDTGTPPFSYQWTSNGQNITGETNSSYIAYTTGSYSCVMSNCSGSASSDNAVLYIHDGVNIHSSPADISVNVNNNAYFSVESVGIGFSYQWQEYAANAWTNISSVEPSATYSINNIISTYSTTSLLTISNVQSLMTGFQYRCIINDICSQYLTSLPATLTILPAQPTSINWIGSTSTDWSDGRNWDSGLPPGLNTDVTVTASATFQPDIYTSYTGECKNLSIFPLASVSVHGTLNLNSTIPGNMTIYSNSSGIGAFLQTDDAVINISGNVTVQKHISSAGYHYLAAPFDNVKVTDISNFIFNPYSFAGQHFQPETSFPSNAFPNMYEFDEHYSHNIIQDQNAWLVPGASETMTPAKGYAPIFNSGNSIISFSKPAAELNGSHIGNDPDNINSKNIVYDVTRELKSTDIFHNYKCLDDYGNSLGQNTKSNCVSDGPTNGYHIVGNPYISSIDLTKANDIFWNYNSTIAFFKPTSRYYGVFGYFSILLGGFGSFSHSQYLQPMEAFYISNLNTDFTGNNQNINHHLVRFTNDMRTIIPVALSSNYYEKKDKHQSDFPSVYLSAYMTKNKHTKTNSTDETVIFFYPKASINYDPKFDAIKLFNTDPYTPNIYTLTPQTNDKSQLKFAIKGFPDEALNRDNQATSENGVVIPLGIEVNTYGNYTIEADLNNMKFPAYLIDLKNNASQDLTTNGTYSFDVDRNDERRFLLKLGLSSNNNQTSAKKESCSIYSTEKNLYIRFYNAENAIAELSIYTITGQMITKKEHLTTGSFDCTLELPAGIYFAKVISANKVYIQKIYIH